MSTVAPIEVRAVEYVRRKNRIAQEIAEYLHNMGYTVLSNDNGGLRLKDGDGFRFEIEVSPR